MPSDAFTPITTSRSLQSPLGHRIYTTTREVATEYPLPAIGSLLSDSNFIAGFTGHYILDVTDSPKASNGKRVAVTHGTIPSGTYTEYESLAYTFPPFYPTPGAFYAGGSRPRSRVVVARVTYEYSSTPSSWLAVPTIWDLTNPASGPFEVISFMAEAAGASFVGGDGTPGAVGDYLNPSFISHDTINNLIEIRVPGDLAFDIQPSAPSATQYNSWITSQTEFMASRTVHKWYAFYMRRTVYVRAQ
jgi:hypothetical protein